MKRIFYLIQVGLLLSKKLKKTKKLKFSNVQPVIGLLVISETSYFGNIFGQSDNLMTVTKFVIVPNVQHDIFSVF